jgi:hypothetical protein
MLIQTQSNGHTKQTHAHNKDKYREHRYTHIHTIYNNIKAENNKICFNNNKSLQPFLIYNYTYIRRRVKIMKLLLGLCKSLRFFSVSQLLR